MLDTREELRKFQSCIIPARGTWNFSSSDANFAKTSSNGWKAIDHFTLAGLQNSRADEDEEKDRNLLFRKQMFRGNLPRGYIIFELNYSSGRPACIHNSSGTRYDLDLSCFRQPLQLQSLCECNLSRVRSSTSS